MRIKINLIGKRKRVSKNKSLFVVLMSVAFGSLFLFFLVFSGYVALMTYSLNRRVSAVLAESIQISTDIRQNNEGVNKFVLSKNILDYLAEVDAGKFHYKRYMDEIVALLPPTVELTNVDFQIKGWVAVSVFVPNTAFLRSFEDRIKDKTIFDQTVFSSIFSEGITRDKNGGYVIKLQFELKKNV